MFLITYIAGYSASIGTLFWLVIAEIFPLHVRGLAMSFVTGIQWAANFLVSMTFISLLHAAGIGGAFATYAVLCLVACIFCWRMVPETKGISLEAIEHNLKQGLPARKLGQTQHFQHAS